MLIKFSIVVQCKYLLLFVFCNKLRFLFLFFFISLHLFFCVLILKYYFHLSSLCVVWQKQLEFCFHQYLFSIFSFARLFQFEQEKKCSLENIHNFQLDLKYHHQKKIMTSSPPSQHNTPRQGNFAVHSNFYSLANYNEEENSNNNMNKRPKSSPRSSPASSSISRNGGNNHHQFRNHSINSNSSSTNSSYFSKNIMTKRNSSPATTRPSTTDSKTGQHIYSSKTVRKKYPIGESAQKTKEENISKFLKTCTDLLLPCVSF